MDLCILWLLVWCRDTGELLDLTSLRLLVQTLRISVLASLDASIDKDLNERQFGDVSLVQLPCDLTVSLVRRDERSDGDSGGGGEEKRNFRDTTNILLAIPGRETEVLVQAETDVVAIETVGRLVEREKVLFESGCDGRLARGRETSEPDCETLLVEKVGSLFVGDMTGMEGDVGSHLVCVFVILEKRCGGVDERKARRLSSTRTFGIDRLSTTFFLPGRP